MIGLARDRRAEPVSIDQVLRRERGQDRGKWKIHFPCSAYHKKDWHLYSVDAQSAELDDHT